MIVCLDFWYQLLYNYHGVEMNIFNAIFALFDMLTVLHNLYTFGHICSMWLLGLLIKCTDAVVTDMDIQQICYVKWYKNVIWFRRFDVIGPC